MRFPNMNGTMLEGNAARVDYCPEEIDEHFIATYPIDLWESEGYFNRVEDLMRHENWINCHWMTFEPAKAYVYLIFAMVYIFLFIIGFSSNVIVIYIIISTKKLRMSPASLLVVNLALGNLLITLMVPISIFNSLHKGPAAGKWGCYMFGFISSLGALVAVLTLAAIAVERFLVISGSLKINKKPTRNWSCVVCLVVWIFSIGFTGLPLVGLLGRYAAEGYLISCSFDYLTTDWSNRSFVFSFFFFAWLFPLLVTIGSYISILRVVIHTRGNVTLRINRGKRQLNEERLELDVAKNLVGLITIWMIAWTPYAVVALVGFAGYGHLVTPIGAMIAGTFGKSAACIDPFIYALNHPKIRRAIIFRFFSGFLHAERAEGRDADIVIQCSPEGYPVIACGSSSNRNEIGLRHAGMYQVGDAGMDAPLRPPTHRLRSPNRL